MSIKSLLFVVCIFASLTIAESSYAQRARVRLNQDFRYLGAFQSAGYQWRNPGPCVGYYNPYSHHNSALRIGGYPQGAHSYMSRYGGGNYGYTNNFDIPTGLGQDNSAPPASGNSVPSVVDKTEDTPAAEVTDDELSDLEKEVQSIMNEGSSEKLPSKKDNLPTDKLQELDETSMWPGFNEFGKRNLQRRNYPAPNRSRAASRPNPYRTW